LPTIDLQNIRNFACQGANLRILAGETLVLVGPNGAGKTTLLNVVAGLVCYKGSVLFDGAPVDSLPARKRNVGYVFQDLVLFPHMNVTTNVAYGIQALDWPQDRIERRVTELLEVLRIPRLASRYPTKLSGGEKQRVALARALAAHPKILLLDEPFNNLDRQTTRLLRTELKLLQRDLGTTMIIVTHDLTEVEGIADRIAIMLEGRIEQVGRPDEVLLSPGGTKTAECIGFPNVLACQKTRDLGHGLATVACDGIDIVVPHNRSPIRKIIVWPRDVLVSLYPPPSQVNAFEGLLSEIIRQPGSVQMVVEVGGCRLMAELPQQLFESMSIAEGDKVYLELNLMKIRTYEEYGISSSQN